MSTKGRAKKAEIIKLDAWERQFGPKVARIVKAGEDAATLITLGDGAPPVPARVAVPLDGPTLVHAAEHGQEALVVFEDGRPDRPIVVALLASSTPHLDSLLGASPAPQRVDARLDGRRVVLEAGREIVLRCGRSSLTMTEDGTVSLRGFKIVSQADGVQKIRGRRVQIN